MRALLTDEVVKSIRPLPTGELIVSDTEDKGLRLKVTPAGGRTWFCQYRGGDGKQKKLTLGSADDTPVKVARDLFRAAMAKVSAGRDPHAEKMATMQLVDREPTLADAWKLYDERVVSRSLKDKTSIERRRLWDKDVPAALKRKYLADVTKIADPLERARRISRADLLELQARMASRPGTANHLFRVLKAFFNWCEGDGQLVAPHSNPLHKFKMLTLKKRHFVLESEHLRKLGAALAAEEMTGWPPAVHAIWFLILSGFRKEEALQLKWADIDLDKRTVSLADTKTGAQTRVLGAGAIDVLEQAAKLREGFGSPYVFPSPRDRRKPIQNVRSTLKRACEAAGLPFGVKDEGVWLHGLRHNFGGAAARATSNAVTVRDLLGHAQLGTTSGYMKAADTTLRDAADQTTEALARDLKANVVRLRG